MLSSVCTSGDEALYTNGLALFKTIANIQIGTIYYDDTQYLYLLADSRYGI